MNDPLSQEIWPAQSGAKSAADEALHIILNDESLVVVVKPAGMSVHRNSDDRVSDNYLLQRLRDQTGDWLFPIHRLDRATSGLVVFAKAPEIAAAVSAQFANREVLKQYVALVRGHTKPSDSIAHRLISMRGRTKPEGHPAREPQEALTEFETVNSWTLPFSSGPYQTTRCSLVNVFPKTGRWHQIRRHFNYHSYPVIGDSSHGDTRVNKAFTDQLGIQRLMLMASFLKFSHPKTNEPVHLECDIDADFQTAVKRIEAAAIPE
ncbi:MAG: pseudouridine synthase [Fuerstiella sp.]